MTIAHLAATVAALRAILVRGAYLPAARDLAVAMLAIAERRLAERTRAAERARKAPQV